MYTFFEKAVHKGKLFLTPAFAHVHQGKINNTDFTIISNNCWAGVCYEYFGLPKLSPTIGGYFFAEDYIKFIFNLKHYLNCNMEIIDAHSSFHYDALKEKEQLNIPIGQIDDIEFVFLHYKDPEIALDKWQRRVKRVNYNNIILKFSYMNECNDFLFEKFMSIQGIKKIGFKGGNGEKHTDLFYYPEYKTPVIRDDTFYWNKYLDVISLINRPATPYNL